MMYFVGNYLRNQFLGLRHWCRSYQWAGNSRPHWRSRGSHLLPYVLGVSSKIQQNLRKSLQPLRSAGLPSPFRTALRKTHIAVAAPHLRLLPNNRFINKAYWLYSYRSWFFCWAKCETRSILSNILKVSKEDIAWLKWKKALEGHGVTVRKEEEEYKSTIYNLSGF